MVDVLVVEVHVPHVPLDYHVLAGVPDRLDSLHYLDGVSGQYHPDDDDVVRFQEQLAVGVLALLLLRDQQEEEGG